MKKAKLEKLCRLEFSKIPELYHPKDDFSIHVYDEELGIYRMYYTSHKWHEEIPDRLRGQDPYKGKTMLDLSIEKDLPDMGCIHYISINEKIRGRSIGKAMMIAMERILRKTGKIAVFSSEITNPSFFKAMGYALDDISSDEVGYRFGIKVIKSADE